MMTRIRWWNMSTNSRWNSVTLRSLLLNSWSRVDLMVWIRLNVWSTAFWMKRSCVSNRLRVSRWEARASRPNASNARRVSLCASRNSLRSAVKLLFISSCTSRSSMYLLFISICASQNSWPNVSIELVRLVSVSDSSAEWGTAGTSSTSMSSFRRWVKRIWCLTRLCACPSDALRRIPTRHVVRAITRTCCVEI